MRLSDLIQQDSVSTLVEPGSADPSSNSLKNLRLILSVVKHINNSLILDDVLKLVLDSAIAVTKAERAILLFADEAMKLQCVLARNADKESLDARAITYSTSIVNDVFRSGELFCIESAQSDAHYDKRESIKSLALETILCAPLSVEDQKIGVIYVDSRYIHSVNRQDVIDIFEIFTGQAATAIRNATLYENLQKSYRELQDANEKLIRCERLASRGEMAAEISHELRNQLGLAMLELDLLRSFPANYSRAMQKKKIASAQRILKRISGFAANLIESSGFKTVKKKNNLNKVVSEFLIFIKTLEKFSRLNITLSLDDSLPEFMFDANQIQQVFLNLLKNTVEACESAAIEIATSYGPKTKAVAVSFKDNGPGISEEVRKKLFFEKLTLKEHGHGYGLSICGRIIESHGGTISVNSKPGCGAEFVFSLPIEAD
jgi:signal transduction histidine kinase